MTTFVPSPSWPSSTAPTCTGHDNSDSCLATLMPSRLPHALGAARAGVSAGTRRSATRLRRFGRRHERLCRVRHAQRLAGSVASRISLVRALEPNGHSGRGLDGDQAAKKSIAALLDDNVVLEAVGPAGRDDLVDLLSRFELELPAETVRVSRVFGRGALQSNDRFPVLNGEEAGKFVALIYALESEQLVERTLGVLVGNVHDRMKQHILMLSYIRRNTPGTDARIHPIIGTSVRFCGNVTRRSDRDGCAVDQGRVGAREVDIAARDLMHLGPGLVVGRWHGGTIGRGIDDVRHDAVDRDARAAYLAGCHLDQAQYSELADRVGESRACAVHSRVARGVDDPAGARWQHDPQGVLRDDRR